MLELSHLRPASNGPPEPELDGPQTAPARGSNAALNIRTGSELPVEGNVLVCINMCQEAEKYGAGSNLGAVKLVGYCVFGSL